MKWRAAALLLVVFTALFWHLRPVPANVACTLPFDLQNGTTADATQVMANYNELVSCLGNAAAAGANSDITSLTGLTTPIPASGGGSTVYLGGTSSGSANLQVIASTTPTGYSLQPGYETVFLPGFTNTASTSLNINSQGVITVYRPGNGGALLPLSGGELVAGQLAAVYYDGAEYQLLNSQTQQGGIGTVTTITASTNANILAAPNHNVVIGTGGQSITSFGSPSVANNLQSDLQVLANPRYFVTFASASSANTLVNSATLNLPGDANITTAADDTLEAIYLGSGAWQIVNYTRYSGAAVVTPAALPSFQQLKIVNDSGTPSTEIDWSYSHAVLLNSSTGLTLLGASQSGTINLTTGTSTSTCNGMDGESRGSSQFLYLYAISNGTTWCGLASTSDSNPTYPSGYNYHSYMGAMLLDGSGNLMRSVQYGAEARLTPVKGSNTPWLTPLASADVGVVWTSVSLSSFVPATATEVALVVNYNSSASIAVAPDGNYPNINVTSSGIPCVFNDTNSETLTINALCRLTLEAASIYYQNGSTANGIYLYGWRDVVNAS